MVVDGRGVLSVWVRGAIHRYGSTTLLRMIG